MKKTWVLSPVVLAAIVKASVCQQIRAHSRDRNAPHRQEVTVCSPGVPSRRHNPEIAFMRRFVRCL
jgi:hypothetical protein